jgi:hypothetical protein
VPHQIGGSTVFSSVSRKRDDDARVADAHEFVADVDRLAAGAQHGGPPPRLDRISGPDRTGTAFAVVDSVGRFVDIGLLPGWWTALGPAGVAAGLLEALQTARMKAALVPMILRRHGITPPEPVHDGFLDAARDRIAEAYRLIDDADKGQQAVRVVAGTRGLFRVVLRGCHLDRAEVAEAGLTAADTDRLVADCREALAEAGGAAVPQSGK